MPREWGWLDERRLASRTDPIRAFRLRADTIGVSDLERSLTFLAWNRRARRLANMLLGLGLVAGDRFAVSAYNTLEWADFYFAAAKAGLIVLPINVRLVGPEIRFMLEDATPAALIVQDELIGPVEEIRAVVANIGAWQIEVHDQTVTQGKVVGTQLQSADHAAMARAFGLYAERVEREESGLAWVPDLQPLAAWDDAERRWRQTAG